MVQGLRIKEEYIISDDELQFREDMCYICYNRFYRLKKAPIHWDLCYEHKIS